MTSLWIPHPGKQLLFALLSLADLALTWRLLSCADGSDGQVYEANPVARWWLDHFGWVGLAGFKAALVLVVAALTVVIARSRPRAAGGVLGLGCAALAGVVLYSVALCAGAGRTNTLEEHLGAINRQSQEAYRRLEAYYAARTAVCAELAAGRRTLQEAAEWAARSEKGNDPRWLRAEASREPGRPVRELFAAYVIRHAVVLEPHPQAAWRVALRLEREFERTYGSAPPRGHRLYLLGTEPDSRDDLTRETHSPAARRALFSPAGRANRIPAVAVTVSLIEVCSCVRPYYLSCRLSCSCASPRVLTL